MTRRRQERKTKTNRERHTSDRSKEKRPESDSTKSRCQENRTEKHRDLSEHRDVEEELWSRVIAISVISVMLGVLEGKKKTISDCCSDCSDFCLTSLTPFPRLTQHSSQSLRICSGCKLQEMYEDVHDFLRLFVSMRFDGCRKNSWFIWVLRGSHCTIGVPPSVAKHSGLSSIQWRWLEKHGDNMEYCMKERNIAIYTHTYITYMNIEHDIHW